MPRLKQRYDETIVPTLLEKLQLANRLRVPRLKKICVNIGVGEATEDPKTLESAVEDVARITGQRPALSRARKSVSNFRLRQGSPIGCHVTLRRSRMYEFLDRLVSVAIPRVRDFRGLPASGFDGRGSYSMGIAEQLIFPEIDVEKVTFVTGMDITMVISGGRDDWSKELLTEFGMPFRD